jgi:predicted SAM-dependent methyltransferase
MVKCLNLGCGSRFHPDWVNLDLYPSSRAVQQWDLQNELPFPDGSFDVVYHSHVLEHFSQQNGLRFLERCRKVLRPGGILRVVVPDLERIVEFYCDAFNNALNRKQDSQFYYDWAIIEMFDQTTREFSGGEMVQFVRKATPSQLTFLKARLGGELDRMLPRVSQVSRSETSPQRISLGNRLRRLTLRLLVGTEGLAAYDRGRFRSSGEVHIWMYDRYSLGRALELVGFAETKQFGPSESGIANWSGFNLDTEPDGRVYKPDSLYMEASKP